MLYVHGVGHFHPPNVIDNAFLESLDIGTTEDWITSRVGIHGRRTVLPLDYIKATKNQDLRAAVEAAEYSNAETGALAARAAMARAGVTADQIGMVVAGGCSPDWCIPAEASAIAQKLGIECAAIDLHSACSTFGAQLHVLNQMGPALPDFVLCVIPENTTRIVDFRDRSSAILFGDATAAVVVSTKHPSRAKVLHTELGGSPEGAMEVQIPRTGFFSQNGAKVQKFAIKRMTDLYLGARERLAGTIDPTRLVYIGHQANLTMLQSVVKRCEIPPDRHWFNIDKFGNQAAAGAPTVLSENWESVQPGEHVAVVVVGSGLSWSSVLLEFS